MSDLIEFLRARLDEDEAVARAAAEEDSGVWFVGEKWNVYDVSDFTPESGLESNQLMAYGNLRTASEHIARHDPARALREVTVYRRMIEAYERVGHGESTAPHEDMRIVAGTAKNSWHAALRMVSLIYEDHPDYQQEWAPY